MTRTRPPVRSTPPALGDPGLPGTSEAGERTLIHLLRHGEVHNPEGILYGRLPGFRLSEHGAEQARTVARAFTVGGDHDIVAVTASPLQRAQETARPLGEATGLAVGTAEQLIEAGNAFEGQQVAGRGGALRDPARWPLLRDPLRPSWGEPYLEIAHRMVGVVYRELDRVRGHEAVLVSHQLPVYTTRRFLEGRRLWHDPRSRQCSLASVTTLVFDGDTFAGLVYSEPAGASDPSQTGA